MFLSFVENPLLSFYNLPVNHFLHCYQYLPKSGLMFINLNGSSRSGDVKVIVFELVTLGLTCHPH